MPDTWTKELKKRKALLCQGLNSNRKAIKMGNWEDRFESKKEEEKLKVGFTINFKTMCHILGRIEEETKEWDSKYPKSELWKMWAAIMGVFMILFIFTHNVLAVATVPFMMFYFYALIQIFKTWKRFKYSVGLFWGLTIPLLIVEGGIGFLLQNLIF